MRRSGGTSAPETLGENASPRVSVSDIASPPAVSPAGVAPAAVSTGPIAPPIPLDSGLVAPSRAVSAAEIAPTLPLAAPPANGRRQESARPEWIETGAPADHGFPRWLRVLDQVHSSAPSPATLGADTLVAVAAGTAAGLSAGNLVILVALILAIFTASGLYTRRTSLETQGVSWYLARAAGPVVAVVAIRAAVLRPLTELEVAGYLAAGLVLVRAVTWAVVLTARRRGRGLHRTIVIGADEMTGTVVSKLRAFPEAGLLPVDVLHPGGDAGNRARLPEDLPTVMAEHGIRHVVLLPDGDQDGVVTDCIERCDGLDVTFSMVPPLAELFLHPCLVAQVGGLPLIPLGKVSRSGRTVPGKRQFDLVVGSCLLLVGLPVMALTAAAIWLQDRGPILFRQQRVGQDGKRFAMLKFRSMVVDAEHLLPALQHHNVTDGLLFKMAQDPRVTRVGQIIRRLSIDELPQLLNVLRGEMSLVGPRPLPVDPEDFGTLDGKRHSVPPGITGYWQIAGSTGLTYDEMVKLDFAYINNWSVWLDARLLARTLPALLHRRGPC